MAALTTTSQPSVGVPADVLRQDKEGISLTEHIETTNGNHVNHEATNGIHANGEAATSSQNPSLQVTADHTIKMVEAPIQEPERGDVLIHVKTTGICGSVSASYEESWLGCV